MNDTKTKMQLLSRSVLQQEASSIRVLKIIIVFIVLVTGFFIYWSTNVPLNEVVIAEGKIQPLEGIAYIQHLSGGKIIEAHVQERTFVEKGDILFRLDSTLLEYSLKQKSSELYYLRIQRNLLIQELEIQKNLYEQQLISIVEYLDLQREIASIRGKIILAEQQIEQYKRREQEMVVYAPINGTIHDTGTHGVGTIIEPGETVFTIIPKDAKFYAQINIAASQIGAIKPGLPVVLKFSAYNFARYGGMNTNFKEFSATTFYDQKGEPYYQGIVELPRNYLGNNPEELPVFQGMTVSAEILTGTKTLFEYLFLPVKASLDSAFSEP
ncbi:MAG: HlyD family efflux transporter periplasmic adaptor subunit [Spirochaetales bacterium]|nr:HlyD family efflux transporter periplasmic adaptor subunit [Spirochaetales bacterium]